MQQTRIVLASVLSCALLFAGLLIGSLRPAHTQIVPRTTLSPAATRQYFAENLNVSLESGQWANTSQGGTPITVPAGRTMVVDYVSSYVNISAGQHPQIMLRIGSKGLQPNSGVGWIVYLHGTEIPVTSATQHMVVASQPLGLHLDAGSTLRADLMRPQTETTGRLFAPVTISGYLE